MIGGGAGAGDGFGDVDGGNFDGAGRGDRDSTAPGLDDRLAVQGGAKLRRGEGSRLIKGGAVAPPLKLGGEGGGVRREKFLTVVENGGVGRQFDRGGFGVER